MTPHVFNRGAYNLQGGGTPIVWGSDTIKARLSRTSESSINKDATSMTGLGDGAIGDQTLGSKVGPTEDTTNDLVKYSSGNLTFTSVTGTEVDKIIVFKFVTDDAGSTPIAVVNLNPARTPNGGDIVVTCPANGWFYTQQ